MTDDDDRDAYESDRCPRRQPTSTVPPPDVQADMRDALDGPRSDAITLLPCPACSDCGLCGGLHMVSASTLAEWRKVNA